MSLKSKHIAVLKGGLSPEREVSLASGAAVFEALENAGYKVTSIDAGHDLGQQLVSIKPDLVFNALHGTYGEDGCVQGLLEMLQIPYTHSGVMASSIAMCKPTAKVLFENVDIQCTQGRVVFEDENMNGQDPLPRPYVIKPVAEGSSVGVYIIREGDNRDVSSVLAQGDMLVEHFIAGRELTVGVMGDEVSDVCEIAPKDGFYDYKNKYTAGQTEYLIPASLPDEIAQQAQKYAWKAHDVLGCRGVSRSDFRYGEDGLLYMMEINTHPGMTATSLIPKLAKNMGMSFLDVVELLLSRACLDHG